MATKKEPKASRQGGRAREIEELAPGSAEVVRRATDVLESELTTGIAAAQKAQRRFREERKVEAADLQEALSRFREDGHAVVDLARNLTAELRSDSTNELAQRLFKDAHEALDLALGLVDLAPDLINRLTQMTGMDKPQAAPESKAQPRQPGTRSKKGS
ncbi:MAG TPA: hypothetical protein VLQ45_27410 [Thermoanaerobaculia bacterium]|nr:hypothetical protein [Thermoanaerobaculia bacterium]